MERRSNHRATRFIALALAAICAPASAKGLDLFSRETISGVADVRLVGADGERSWIDGGFGKARFGGSDDRDFRLRPEAAEATLAWRPRFSWSLAGTIVATAQQGQQHEVDVSEAFLSYKPMASGSFRLSARAGLFWPPVSREHSGPEWTVAETITPSAINSWIGEEVKLVGLEVTGSAPLGDGRLSITAALFGFNDTAGTLIAFRGWALHDEKAVAFGKQPLPSLSGFMTAVQSPYTRPVIELDDRIGYYARLAWAPLAPLRIEALHYDNRGDPEAVNKSREWGWRTRFDSVGAVLGIGKKLELRSQAMQGRTEMGFPSNGVIWIDTRFRSAYLLATCKVDNGSLSGRIEAFDTRNRGSRLTGEDDEHGWAATLAARRPIGSHAAILMELAHIESRRDARRRDGLDPQQEQTVFQLALRLHL